MNIPNLLTLLRIALVPIFFILLLTPGARIVAFTVFAAAALTDALDGLLARILNQKTELGAFLDPLADKMLILSGLIGIYLTKQPVHEPPLWFLVVVLFRELVFVIGFFTFFFFSKKMIICPNLLGKATTLTQMFLVVVCLLNWPGMLPLTFVSGALTVTSGLVYTWREWKILTKETA